MCGNAAIGPRGPFGLKEWTMPEWERVGLIGGRKQRQSMARRLKLAALAFPVLLIADVAVSPFTPVSAVDNTGQFEMDGNIVQNALVAPPYDWASLFNSTGAPVSPAPAHMIASVFAKDAGNPDQTYFNTVDKDILPINNGSSSEWSC